MPEPQGNATAHLQLGLARGAARHPGVFPRDFLYCGTSQVTWAKWEGHLYCSLGLLWRPPRLWAPRKSDSLSSHLVVRAVFPSVGCGSPPCSKRAARQCAYPERSGRKIKELIPAHGSLKTAPGREAPGTRRPSRCPSGTGVSRHLEHLLLSVLPTVNKGNQHDGLWGV